MLLLDLGLNALVTGVVLGSIYATIAIGLAITFGLLHVPNVAHPAMVVGGNLLTHYNYHQCDANVHQTNNGLEITVRSSDGASNLHVRADLSLASHSALPAGSPFGSRSRIVGRSPLM